MLRLLLVSAFGLAMPLLAGCSTHPLPGDFARKSTFDIVKHMRCEIQKGVEAATFPRDVHLHQVAVGFDFVFTIQEDANANAGTLKFFNPVSGGGFKLDFDAGTSASRKNTRSFRVVDRLHNFAKEPGCDEASQRANFAYPITGRIGLDEIVTTFAKLRSMTGFEELKDPASGLMSDKLEFTTKFTAGVAPNLTITDGKVGSLELTNWALDAGLGRDDMHQVTIVIAVKPENAAEHDAAESGRRGAFRTSSFDGEANAFVRRNETPAAIPGPVLPESTSDAESRVIDELNRQRVRDDLRDFPALR